MKPGIASLACVFAIASLFDVSAGVFELLCFAAVGVCVLIVTKPPWLLHSPLGRWLRRWRRS